MTDETISTWAIRSVILVCSVVWIYAVTRGGRHCGPAHINPMVQAQSGHNLDPTVRLAKCDETVDGNVAHALYCDSNLPVCADTRTHIDHLIA